MSYYPNHMLSQIAYGNGVNDLYDEDPNHIARPAKTSTANALSGANWIFGTFEYDGAGNIKALRGTSEPIGRPATTGQLYGYDFAHALRAPKTKSGLVLPPFPLPEAICRWGDGRRTR